MAQTNYNFTKSELQQTENILKSSHLRTRPLVQGFTIDGETSLDLDDAIWVENHGDRGKIQIHIADPTEVIDPNSPLDKAVKKRISTLYLSQGTIPMLPLALSEQKLSLLEGEAKLTITVEIEVEATGNIISYRVFESCFVSLGKLSYQEAEQISNSPEHELFLPLQMAQIWAKILNYQRVKNGAFAGIIKGNFYINEDGNFSRISCNSEVLIAEYMILANTIVAQWLSDKSLTALYRNHLPQGSENQDLIWQYLASEDNQDFRSQYAHCLAKAIYSPVCQGHLALATPYYLHFTSPLRRLADFIVHRIVKAELAGLPNPYTLEEITTLAEAINNFIIKNKQKQVNYLKEKRDNKLLKITNYSNLDSKDFSRLLELSIRNNSISEIKNELEIRLQAKQLTNTDLSLILFDIEDKKLQQLTFKNIDNKSFVNLLNNCPKILEKITNLSYEEIICNPEKLIFVSRLIITIDNHKLTTAKAIKGKNKKDTKNKTYKAWLQAYINKELVDHELLEYTENNFLNKSELEVVELKHKLPLSTLNNLCQQKNWDKPNFSYEQDNGIFTCTAILNLEETIITKVGRGTKKRTAQNIAADQILLELEQTMLDD